MMKQFFISLVLFLGQQAVYAEVQSSVTVYAYPPYRQLDWSSPRALLKTFMKTGIERVTNDRADVRFRSDFGEDGKISSYYISTMGHTITHVSCQTSSGVRYDKWSSFSGQDFSEVDQRLVLTEKRGMGSLFYDFVDGHIISGPENYKRLVHYKNRDPQVKPVYIQFEITPRQCDDLKRMVSFFESFHFPAGTTLEQLQARPPEQILYFNTMDPYETYMNRIKTGHGLVGGGCAPYGAAVLKVVGAYDREIFDRTWGFHLNVSEKLIGGTIDAATGRPREVSVADLLVGATGSRWVNDGIPNRSIYFYDPQMIWGFINQVKSCLKSSSAASCTPAAGAWVNKVHSRVSEGAKHVYSDVIPARDENLVPTGGTVQVQTAIEGIVIRK